MANEIKAMEKVEKAMDGLSSDERCLVLNFFVAKHNMEALAAAKKRIAEREASAPQPQVGELTTMPAAPSVIHESQASLAS
jgi:hypothetical protein